MAASRVLFTPAFFETYTRLPEAPPEERDEVFFYKAKWPPHSPYDRWRGRSWDGWITAMRKRQITLKRLGSDPRTGKAPQPVPVAQPLLIDKTESSCGKHGTTVEFVDSPKEAAKQAKLEEKLVLVLHVSGLFEDPKLT